MDDWRISAVHRLAGRHAKLDDFFLSGEALRGTGLK